MSHILAASGVRDFAACAALWPLATKLGGGMQNVARLHKVARLAQLGADRGLRVALGETEILLVRDHEAIRAYAARCPHAQAPLDEGAVCEGRIVCPWHKATFSVSDGALLEPPALTGLTQYRVSIEDDAILVDPQPLADRAAAAKPPAGGNGRDDAPVLIAGAGAAGCAAAAALREFGFAGRILLVGQEPRLPFDRTALSKFVLAGQMQPEAVPELLPQTFFATQVEYVEATVESLDVAENQAVLSTGRTIDFRAAIIAAGAQPRRPDLAGADLAGVHVLRTRGDAAALLADARPGARAVILGASFIGLEAASALREQKLDVTVVSPDEIPFARQFGERIGRALRRLHEAQGTGFYAPSRAIGLEGESRVTGVVLDDDARLVADLVIAGTGVQPATGFVSQVTPGKDGALNVDAGMWLAGSVYAVGDVAAFPLDAGGAGRVRIEHWRVAQQQARVAAQNVLGGSARYDGVPFFWTFQCGKRFEYLGHAVEWDEEVFEGDVEAQKFVALLGRRGLVAAVIACDRERVTAFLAEAMRRPLSMDAARRIIRTRSDP